MRFFSILALILLLARPAAAELFPAESFALANGLQVVVIPNHMAPVVFQIIAYKAGAADGEPGKNGVAHFLEHLMFKGTDSLQPGAFSQRIAERGGDDNAFTSQDVTAYHQEIAKAHLPLIMAMEADRMRNLRLTDDVVYPERDVILNERAQVTENDPGARLAEMAAAALFLNHPYRLPIIGWRHEIAAYTTADALRFYRRWYAPENAVLVIAGDVATAEVKALAEKFFGAIPRGETPARHRLTEPPRYAPARVTLSDPRVATPSLTRAYVAPAYDRRSKDPYALAVLAEMLGDGLAGRLHRALVIEQGVALAAGAGYDPQGLDYGTFSFYLSVRAPEDLPKAEAALDAEIARLTRAAPDAADARDYQAAKDRLGITVVKANDSLAGPARLVATALASGRRLEDVQAWPARIAESRVADAAAAAAKVFRSENAVTSILLPAPAAP